MGQMTDYVRTMKETDDPLHRIFKVFNTHSKSKYDRHCYYTVGLDPDFVVNRIDNEPFISQMVRTIQKLSRMSDDAILASLFDKEYLEEMIQSK